MVSLKEIEENDYNLNIRRYVDTFEAEESIDLGSISAELKNIETDLQKVNTSIAGFCKELNIETPF
ncbi:hypothetical protein D3C86_1721000 [compost metagenome]